MFKELRGKEYGERLKCLNLWTLEERRNRQHMVQIFKMYKGFTRLSIDELFERDANIKGTRGHTLRLKNRVLRMSGDTSFFGEWLIDGIVWTRKQ